MEFYVTLLLEVALGVALIVYLFYKYLTKNNDYWKNKGVVFMEPSSLFSKKNMSVSDAFRESSKASYDRYKGERYVGMVVRSEPQLLLLDPDLIKHVMTKDFSHFADRSLLPDMPNDFLLKHLFHMEGDAWRNMRSKLTPTFTSGKMKLYFVLIESVMKQLTDYLEPLAEKSAKIEVKDLMARFTTDVIATCAFGLEVNSINDPENKIRQIGRLMISPNIRDFLASVIYPKVPWVLRYLLPLTHTKPEVSTFMLKLMTDTVDYRKKNNIVRGDFIDLLMKVKDNKLTIDKEDREESEKNGYEEKKGSAAGGNELTLKEMAAQMSVFFAAGFETSSSTTTFLLYELAVNPDLQDKLRKEIDTVIAKNDGKFTYQCLQEMKYLEKCINETLRRYSSLPFLSRLCLKNYQIPGSDLVVDKGVRMVIPTYALHHDSDIYPDPYKFDPERFSDEMINSRHQYSYLPFGEGPRVCIGKRMGFMQVQLAAIALLRNYELQLAPGLPTKLPLDPTHILPVSKIPVELIISKRKD